MKTSRRKLSTSFKVKVAVEAIKEQQGWKNLLPNFNCTLHKYPVGSGSF
ncbi:hypothetical protein [Gelidibacter mesophilus]|nr:hypothetical protein [Gelidibacter mesophilus]